MTIRLIWLFIAIQLVTTGCRKEDPNPETSDRIYSDLMKEADAYSKAVEEEQKKLPGLQKELEKTKIRTMDYKNALEDLEKSKKKIAMWEQLVEYYKIRAERRRVEGRIAYKKAFAEGKQWPAADEYNYYLLNKKLRTANMNWNNRVPKSTHDAKITAAKAALSESSEPEGGGSGGSGGSGTDDQKSSH